MQPCGIDTIIDGEQILIFTSFASQTQPTSFLRGSVVKVEANLTITVKLEHNNQQLNVRLNQCWREPNSELNWTPEVHQVVTKHAIRMISDQPVVHWPVGKITSVNAGNVSVQWLDGSASTAASTDVRRIDNAHRELFFAAPPLSADAQHMLELAERARQQQQLKRDATAMMSVAAAAAATTNYNSEDESDSSDMPAFVEEPIDRDEQARLERLHFANVIYRRSVAAKAAAEEQQRQMIERRKDDRLRRCALYLEHGPDMKTLIVPSDERIEDLDRSWTASERFVGTAHSAQQQDDILVPITVSATAQNRHFSEELLVSLYNQSVSSIEIAQSLCGDYCLDREFEPLLAENLDSQLAQIRHALANPDNVSTAPRPVYFDYEQHAEYGSRAKRRRLAMHEQLQQENDKFYKDGNGDDVLDTSVLADAEFEPVQWPSERRLVMEQFYGAFDFLEANSVRQEAVSLDPSCKASTMRPPTPPAERDLGPTHDQRISVGVSQVPASADNVDLRVISLDVSIGKHRYRDRFEWDTANPNASPEQFVRVLAADLGLSRTESVDVLIALRQALLSQQLSAVNHTSLAKSFGDPAPLALVPGEALQRNSSTQRRRIVRAAEPVLLGRWTPSIMAKETAQPVVEITATGRTRRRATRTVRFDGN